MKGKVLKNLIVRLVVLVLVLCLIPYQGNAVEQTTNPQQNIRVISAENADAQVISTEPKNEASDLEKGEIIEERTENSKVFYNGNNSYTKKIYFEPIHIKENGEYKEVSADLTTDTQDSDLIETENTKLKSNFFSKMENGKYATFEYKNHLLEFSILEASGQEKDSLPAKDSVATYKTDGNQLFYKEIFPQVELRNFTFNQNTKEDIILNSYEGYHQFKFKIITDLTAKKSESGSISFVDTSEQEIFNVPAPIMTDSNYDQHSGEGVSSNDVTYSLEKIDGGYQLTLDADPNWLKDPARKYPVFIDPTTSISISTDTYISSASPTSNYETPSSKWDEALQEYVLRTGYYSSSTGTNYALLKNPISSIKGLNITGATLYTYVTHHYYADPTPNGLWLDKNDADFSPNSVTWNTKPDSTNIASDSVGINQWATFNVTSTVKSWAEGSPNYGFKLHTNGNGQTYWKKIVSSANSTNKPYLSVTYTIPTPAPPTAKVYKNEDDTGYVELSWPEVKEAIGYTVWVYNGKSYESFDVNKGDLDWSTKEEKIWPISEGRYELHHDKDGADLVLNPSTVYQNSGGIYPTNTNYWFRVSVKYTLGESAMSVPITPSIPNLDVPSVSKGGIYSNVTGGSDGYAKLSWNAIAGATGYKVWIFNGKKYEAIDVGNVTSWSTKGQGIWPTTTEISSATPDKPIFHINDLGQPDGKGTELPKEPSKLYTKMGTGYATSNKFFFRVSAYNAGGETIYSPHYFGQVMSNETEAIINYPQMDPPIVEAFPNEEPSGTGYLDISWEPVPNVKNYQVILFNGSNYSYWDVPADQTGFSTNSMGIFPTTDQLQAGQTDFKTDGSGTEFSLDPKPLYKKVFELNGGTDYSNVSEYFVRVKAIYEDGTSPISNPAAIKIPLESLNILTGTVQNINDSKGKINVTWNSISNASGYKVSMYDGVSTQNFDVGNTTSFTTSEIIMDPKIYKFTVSAYDNNRNTLYMAEPYTVEVAPTTQEELIPVTDEDIESAGSTTISGFSSIASYNSFATMAASFNTSSFTFKPGDILITKTTEPATSGYGWVGHSAIVINSTTVLHTSGRGGTEKYPKPMSINEWINGYKRYPTVKVVRPNDSALGKKAASAAVKYFKDKSIPYSITGGPYNIKQTYCSELVWYAYYKSGKEWQIYTTVMMGGGTTKTIWTTPTYIKPYDFLNTNSLKHNKFTIVKTINW